MSGRKIALLLLLLGGAMLVASPMIPWPQEAAPAVSAPSEELVALVQPIIAATLTPADSEAVSEFCTVFADVLADDATGRVIADTGNLHDRLQQSSKLMFQTTGISERHPSLAGQINSILAQAMGVVGDDGIQIVPLDDADRRAKAIAAFKAIAWGVGQ